MRESLQRSAIVRASSQNARVIPHLGMEEVRTIADAADRGVNGERDRLLIQTLFDACLRVSEGLGIKLADIRIDAHGWSVAVMGKGRRFRIAALSPSLAVAVNAYAQRNGIGVEDKVWPITRTRAYQIVRRAMDAAGVQKPDHVGTVHVLRHSGAIHRLRETHNPKALQDQLGHSSPEMTLRYLKTLTAEESIRIQQEVDFNWA